MTSARSVKRKNAKAVIGSKGKRGIKASLRKIKCLRVNDENKMLGSLIDYMWGSRVMVGHAEGIEGWHGQVGGKRGIINLLFYILSGSAHPK